MKLLDLIPTAFAQGGVSGTGGGGGTGNQSNFTIADFNFLNPFKGDDAGAGLNNVLTDVIGLVLTVAAIVAFFYLVFSGFQYITAGGDAGKAQIARQGIVNALIGIVVILVAYIVLRYVGTQFSVPA